MIYRRKEVNQVAIWVAKQRGPLPPWLRHRLQNELSDRSFESRSLSVRIIDLEFMMAERLAAGVVARALYRSTVR